MFRGHVVGRGPGIRGVGRYGYDERGWTGVAVGRAGSAVAVGIATRRRVPWLGIVVATRTVSGFGMRASTRPGAFLVNAYLDREVPGRVDVAGKRTDFPQIAAPDAAVIILAANAVRERERGGAGLVFQHPAA